MNILHKLLLISILLNFLSCGKEEEKYIFTAPVDFKINTLNSDEYLATVANIGVYLPREQVASYNKLLGTQKGVKVYSMPRLEREFTGTGGVLVINIGGDSNINLKAFDLCCPHEKSPDIRVIPNSNGVAKCPKCEGEFDLFGGGYNKKNSLERLQPYSVSYMGNNDYRVYYSRY